MSKNIRLRNVKRGKEKKQPIYVKRKKRKK